ncbi:MAG TPA: rhodanese [Cycloclasticus sp.]|jgi:rhodanese-related sulfurtransferase|nr:rhodanese [Cycloclasticus sp.]HIL93207.1 rhodanese [Cycloclasticus sp.]
MQHISPTELHSLLQEQDTAPFLLDVREPHEFEYCHIEGSHLIPMQQIPNQLTILPKHDLIITICHHGMRSQQVAQFLEQNDFKHLVNLTGGVHAWALSVDNDMPTY